MVIGVSREIKNNENRVGLTPAGAEALIKAGHSVLIEKDGGVGSGFADSDYQAVGAQILADKAEIFNRAEMIIKVKEPLESEYGLFHEGQILFTENRAVKAPCFSYGDETAQFLTTCV